MNKKQILNAIRELSYCQGFYSRLYSKLSDGSDESNEFLNHLVEQNFDDEVSLVMYIEG